MARLRRALPRADAAGPVTAGPVTGRALEVSFVGGNETQSQYEQAITAAIHQRFGGQVGVRWFFPGWNPNWRSYADRVEARLGPCEALVRMTLVRTNLGRHLRRVAGERGVPWVACTGRGRAAIERSIEAAVQVALARRG